MGLTFFGYALCVAYFVFYDEEEAREFIYRFGAINKKFKNLFEKANARLAIYSRKF
jgi:hypothetical protein